MSTLSDPTFVRKTLTRRACPWVGPLVTVSFLLHSQTENRTEHLGRYDRRSPLLTTEKFLLPSGRQVETYRPFRQCYTNISSFPSSWSTSSTGYLYESAVETCQSTTESSWTCTHKTFVKSRSTQVRRRWWPLIPRRLKMSIFKGPRLNKGLLVPRLV